MDKSSTDWSPLAVIIKGFVLVVPWGVIEVVLSRYKHPDIGYTVGIFVGLYACTRCRPEAFLSDDSR